MIYATYAALAWMFAKGVLNMLQFWLDHIAEALQ